MEHLLLEFELLLQFEDFNSNDAFPLLEAYRHKYARKSQQSYYPARLGYTRVDHARRTHRRYLTYNDDIQGTAAVALAAILGAVKMRSPATRDLVEALKGET